MSLGLLRSGSVKKVVAQWIAANKIAQLCPAIGTAKLFDCETGFQHVARQIAHAVQAHIGESLKEYEGSFSVIGGTSREMAAKIIIYDPLWGKESSALAAPRSRSLYLHSPQWRSWSANLATDASFHEIMAGESLDRIAELLTRIAQE